MIKKKIKQKNSKKKKGIAQVGNFTTKSFLSNAFSNYKKK